MKNLTKLLALAILLFTSCEIEKQGVVPDEILNAVYSTSSVTTECVVQDADRCPFGDRQPAANFWWSLNGGTDYFTPTTYFSSTADHKLVFTEYANGTASIIGSTVQGTCVVSVELWLKDRKSWTEWSAEGGAHKKEGCAGNVSNSEDLNYYVIDSEKSRMTSAGGDCVAEGTYGIEQRPDPNDANTPNYGAHVGPGGANYDSEIGALGVSTWGWITDLSSGNRLWVMDFNFTFECEMPPQECAPCDGKVSELTLQYNGDIANANIVVKQKKDDIIVFDGTVQPNETFSFVGQDKKNTLGTEIIVYINGVENTRIHTSCSKPIGPGVISGDFEVTDGASRNGGKLCPEDTPPNNNDCNECDGKATNLEMQYNGSSSATIMVKQKKDDVVVFNGMVEAGGSFEFSGMDKKGTLGTEIILYVDGVENTKIHTSCSQPLGPGLVSGDFTVLGGASLKGGAFCPIDTPPNNGGGDDGDCNECDGKATNLEMQYNGSSSATIVVKQKKDDVVVFNSTVQAGGSFEFSGMDKKGTLGTEIILMVNGVENTRIHTSCSVPLGPGLVSGDFEVLGGASLNGGAFCPIDTPPNNGGGDANDCGECDGKATNLEMQYNGSTSATIVVKQKKDDVVVFNSTVQAGGSFEFSGMDKKGTLGTEIILMVNGVENTRIHTSCSVPLGPGLVSGDFEVLGGASLNGGEFCSVQ